MTSTTEVARAKKQGYRDQGVNFYVATFPSPCLIPVVRYRKAGFHRFATRNAENASALKGGWTREGVAFYAAPPARNVSGDTKFSVIVYPDTQQECCEPVTGDLLTG